MSGYFNCHPRGNSATRCLWRTGRCGSIEHWSAEYQGLGLRVVRYAVHFRSHWKMRRGGEIRRHILSAGKNFTKEENRKFWGSPAKDTFYPLDAASTSTVPSAGRRARFFNSAFKNQRPPGFDRRSGRFEGVNVCPAATPLGVAFACHSTIRAPARGRTPSRNFAAHTEVCGGGDGSGDTNGGDCDVVYAGHNLLGAEMSWLPWPWLSRWWEQHSTKLGLPNGTPVPGSRHACSHDATEHNPSLNNSLLYTQCIMPAAREADADAARAFSIGKDAAQAYSTSWAPLYASLPLLRVTMLREPFSYLISKYFWHSKLAYLRRGLCGKSVA